MPDVFGIPKKKSTELDQINASGTPSASTFLRGDGEWATPPSAAGDVATDAIFDAKGDLPVGTGADTAAKLTVGANDRLLIADSTQATGLRWATPAEVKAALDLEIGTDVAAQSHNHAASEITSGTLAVGRGGTGVTSTTQYAVVLGGGAGALAPVASLGNSGDVLTSAGAGSPPAWATPAAGSTSVADKLYLYSIAR